MKLEVLTTVWGADDQEFAGGVHDVKLTGRLAPLVAGAEAAGTIRILEASADERKKLDRHVQSQEAGEQAYQAAQRGGRWQHGNLQHFVLAKQDALDYDATLDGDHPDKLSEEARGLVVHQLDQAKAALAETEPPA